MGLALGVVLSIPILYGVLLLLAYLVHHPHAE
jgi:hypothetical protein